MRLGAVGGVCLPRREYVTRLDRRGACGGVRTRAGRRGSGVNRRGGIVFFCLLSEEPIFVCEGSEKKSREAKKRENTLTRHVFLVQ